jgi:replication factor C subunit 1
VWLTALSTRTFAAAVDGHTGRVHHVLIMDEVDGMSGNQDRGGVSGKRARAHTRTQMAELITLIKTTHIPIICICNDRQSPKIRSLANYCFDLRFHKPNAVQIRVGERTCAHACTDACARNLCARTHECFGGGHRSSHCRCQ